MKRIAGIAVGMSLCVGALGQGLVNFKNNPNTLVSYASSQGIGWVSGPAGTAYFGLLISASGNPGTFHFSGIYATNDPMLPGQFGYNNATIPGWQPGTTAFYEVFGWSGSLGPTFNPAWLTNHPYLTTAVSSAASGIAGGTDLYGQTFPTLDLFGGIGIPAGFTFSARPASSASIPAIDLNPLTQVSDALPVPTGKIWGYIETVLGTNGMYGWTFYVLDPITITGVGWYDDGLDGLAHAHEIGVWQNGPGQAQLLAKATVEAGTNAPLIGAWRTAQFHTPITLLSHGYNVAYAIAGTYFSESADVVKYVNNSGGTPGPNHLPADSRLRIGNPAYSVGNEFAPLSNIYLDSGVELGPMLFILPPDTTQPPLLRVDQVGPFIFASWPLWASNYVFETSGSLGTGESWATWTNNVISQGATIIKTNAAGAEGFFRLRQK